MSGVECVMPSKESSIENIKAFNSIVAAMLLSENVAIARYVKRKNSAPKLVVLMPSKEAVLG